MKWGDKVIRYLLTASLYIPLPPDTEPYYFGDLIDAPKLRRRINRFKVRRPAVDSQSAGGSFRQRAAQIYSSLFTVNGSNDTIQQLIAV